MRITIGPLETIYFDELSISFANTFPEWGIEQAQHYLRQSVERFPEYCFVAISDQNQCVGAIVCQVGPYQQGSSLLIEAIQVKKAFRNQGVGKQLLMASIEVAKKNHLQYVGMLAPTHATFPLSWYEQIGFHRTGWIELVANMEELLL